MKARAIRGTLLSLAGFGGGQVIRLVSNLILTRILFPEAFGMIALVQVLLIGLDNFSDLGVNLAIIQSKRGDSPEFLNTAWTMQIIRGVILWLLACALTVPVARFYDQDGLVQIIPVLAFTTILSGFRSTRSSLAQRHLILGRWTLIEILAQITGTVIMILLALWLQSVWALVCGSLIGVFVKTVLSHVILPGPKNRIHWDNPAFWEIFHFGKYIFISTIAGYLISQGDRLVLGKYVTLEDLALFSIAFFLATVPSILNVRLTSRVLLPLYRNRPPSANASNRYHIGRARLLLVTGFLGMSAILAISGDALISTMYDARYHTAGPFLVLLSLASIPGLILGGYKDILLASGNSRDYTIINIGTAILKIFILIQLIGQFGVVGAIISLFLVDLITYPFLVYLIRPYRGWYPLHDIGFMLVSLLIGAVALRNSGPAMELLSPVLLQ